MNKTKYAEVQWRRTGKTEKYRKSVCKKIDELRQGPYRIVGIAESGVGTTDLRTLIYYYEESGDADGQAKETITS